MKQGANGRRARGRSGGRKQVPLKMQSFDSNGPDVRVRGHANQVYEKYLSLARDASAAGDRVIAESYFQHAEHYYRIMNETTDPETEPAPRERADNGDGPAEARGADKANRGTRQERRERHERAERARRDGTDGQASEADGAAAGNGAADDGADAGSADGDAAEGRSSRRGGKSGAGRSRRGHGTRSARNGGGGDTDKAAGDQAEAGADGSDGAQPHADDGSDTAASA